MKPWFVFFHLSFSFLLLNSFMRMSKFSRISIIATTLSLASYFTMTSPEGISWQIWASLIVLIHLLSWNKQTLKEKNLFEDYETEIYETYFSEFDDNQFHLILDNSHWEEYSRVGSLKVSKDEIVLKWSEHSEWRFCPMNSIMSVEESSIYFIVDINTIKVVDLEIFQKLMLLAQSSSLSNIAS